MLKYIAILIISISFVLLTLEYYEFKREMRLIERDINSNSELIQTSLGEIEYSIEGKGEAVLVIHGAGGGYDQGLLLANTFTKNDAKKISISRPGFLNTKLNDNNKTPTAHSKMYKELLDKLEIKKVNVLAFSDGGPSALQFAILYPEMCNTLTLVACKSKTPPKETFLQSVIFGNVFKFDFIFWWIAKHKEDSLLKSFGVTKDVQSEMKESEILLIKDFLKAMQPMNLRVDGIYNERNELKMLEENEYDLSKIISKTLIIHAKDDTLQRYDYALYSHKNIRNSKLISYEKGGHMLIGHHDEVYRIYMDFIK